MNPRRLFLALLLPLLGFRLWLAVALPISGDEAYFIWWGRIPDWGFYDHPPMIGWWLSAQLQLSDAAWWLRLTSVLQPLLLGAAVAWSVPHIWPGADEERRWWAALFTLIAPASVWNVLITTDTPLVIFSVLSGLAWLRARRDDDLRWYLVSGILLTGAVLSKYFVVFLGFAYLLDVLAASRRRGWMGLAIAYACCAPALALMAWWNAGHCWPNYMFNFVNRNEDAGLSWKTPLLYAAMMAYLLTPALAWGLWRALRQMRNPVRTEPVETFSLALLVFVPLALLGLLSLVKTIGLHWVLSFLPFAFLLPALALPLPTLARMGKFVAVFAALHVAVAAAISTTTLETWQRTKWYDGIVLTFEAREIAARLKPYQADHTFMSNGYSDAVTLGYNAGRHFGVFGEASSHARHDDILTDFRALDGRNILILRKTPPASGEYEPYFRELTVETFALRGVTFYKIQGRGFDYARYRDTVLAAVKRKYYALPSWLPVRGCYFCDRYFPGQPCRR